MNLRRHTGLAVRAMVRGDLAAIGFMMFVLLVVALTIDLAKWLESIRAEAAATGQSLHDLLLPYVAYRATDIITRLLTMACVAGGFIVTLLRHQRLDDVVLAAAGASPSLRLSSLLITGLLLGSIQLAGESWLRPAAVDAQVRANLGDYGARYHNTDMGTQWLLQDGRALRATLHRGPDAALSNLMVFEGVDQPQLARILHAQRATPTQTPDIWSLTNVTLWNTAGPDPTRHLTDLEVPLALNRENLRWFGIDGYYLPNASAQAIAASGTAAATDAATALAVRKVAIFLPAIFVFLGISLASVGTRGRRLSPFRLLALATVGYLSVVSVKVFWALGIHGVLPPMLAASLPALFALLLASLLQLHQAGYLRRPAQRSKAGP